MAKTGSQFHLKGKGFSGRAVRCRELDPMETEENLLSAAKLVSKDATMVELKKVEWRNAIKLMVTEFTEPCKDPFADGVKWKKVTAGMLEDLGVYFTAKDLLALESIYQNTHEVTKDELEAITGSSVPFQFEG